MDRGSVAGFLKNRSIVARRFDIYGTTIRMGMPLSLPSGTQEKLISQASRITTVALLPLN